MEQPLCDTETEEKPMQENLVGPVVVVLSVPSVLYFWDTYRPVTPGDQLTTVLAGVLVAFAASLLVSPIIGLFERR